MRELALVGFIALCFGLGSYYATQELGSFSIVNFALGAVALVIAFARGVRNLGGLLAPESRRVLLRGLATVVAALALAVGIERAAARTGIDFDWTFEGYYAVSDGTRSLLDQFPGEVRATLYHAALDPRVRRSRLLLRQFADAGPITMRSRLLEEHPEDEDRFEIGTSNTVVFELGNRFETVERPSEGSFYAALYRLLSVEAGTLVLLRGEGEGDPTRDGDTDFSVLAAALQTEGYQLLSVPTASVRDIPPDADAVVLIAPRRRLLDDSLDALRRYLAGGGRLVAMIEPGFESGVEEILAEYGMTSPDAVLMDSAVGALPGGSKGTDIVASNYEVHPATKGLNQNRITFFRGARTFELHKPQPGDDLRRLVLSSSDAWLQREGEDSSGGRRGYQIIAAAGRYPRGDHETRIFAIGDSDFASNRYLRAVYNADLILNGVHWAVSREPQITIRPKHRGTVQFPMPIANSLKTLYGVGLLVPEILLVLGAVVWLRRRDA